MPLNSNLIRVTKFDQTQILEALKEGRLFIQSPAVSAEDTRSAVLSIVGRIRFCATDPAQTDAVWQALLADDSRLSGFRMSRGSLLGAINCYRICAIVRYMLSLGLYQGTHRFLCQLLFPDAPAAQVDNYRRNCPAYTYAMDECIILKSLRHE